MPKRCWVGYSYVSLELGNFIVQAVCAFLMAERDGGAVAQCEGECVIELNASTMQFEIRCRGEEVNRKIRAVNCFSSDLHRLAVIVVNNEGDGPNALTVRLTETVGRDNTGAYAEPLRC